MNKWALGAGVGALAAVGMLSRQQPLSDPSVDFTARGFVRREIGTPPGRMVWYEAGSGQPLIFLHGIGGGASSWTWSRVAPAFTHQYRVIVPDWVGWGASDHPKRFVLFDDYVNSLHTLLQQFDQPAIIVAQSLAAGFAATVANRTPERVERLVLQSPTGGYDFGEDAFKPVPRIILSTLARTKGVNTQFYRLVFHQSATIRSWFTSMGFYHREAVSDEVVNSWLHSARRPNAAYSALPFLAGTLRYDVAPILRDIRVPAIMIWGTEEQQITPQTVERLAAANPAISMIRIPRTRTNIELEAPAHLVAAINAFITTTNPAHA